MSDMTGIQREAMRRAMRGDWALADAIEVLARQKAAAPYGLICGLQEGGRLRYFAYGEVGAADECETCDGDGKDVAGNECEDCDGRGHELRVNLGNYEGDICRIVNLNGDVLFDCDAVDAGMRGTDLPNLAYGFPLLPTNAQATVDAYLHALANPQQSLFLIPEAA